MTVKDRTTSADYEDYFKVTDYFETDHVDFTYRKAMVTEESVFKPEKDDHIVSFEKFDAKKTLVIYNYLKYKLPSIDDEETLKWYQKTIYFFENILSSKINCTKCFITPEDIFINHSYQKIDYKDASDIKVGRLYSHGSIQTLPREIRYYLFKDDYIDFDIANAHPSILCLYGKKHNLKLNGSLSRYIEERKTVMLDIQQELKISLPEVKKKVLMLLNKTWDNNFDKESTTLVGLEEDFKTIRDHLWYSYINGELQGYKSPVEQSVVKKKAQYTLKNGTINATKRILLKKISLQSFYCQTQETVHITKIVRFLRQEYKSFIKNSPKSKMTDYYPYTEKKVKLGAEHSLFIIPFFDGFYITSPITSFMDSLKGLVDNYNKEESSVLFVPKEIEEKVDRIPDTDELRKFGIIYSWLARSSAKHFLDVLIFKMDLNKKIVELLKDKHRTLGKNSIKNSDKDYKEFLNSIKTCVYEKLLEYPITKEDDIVEIIKNM